MTRWCPPGAARSGCGTTGPRPRARRRRPGSATGGCCGWRAALARDAVLSGSNELYHRDLAVNDALALALKGPAGRRR